MISARLLQIILVVIAGASVAIADALIKKTSIHTTSIVTAMKNPLMIWVILLYALQIILFSYVFIKKWDLGIV